MRTSIILLLLALVVGLGAWRVATATAATAATAQDHASARIHSPPTVPVMADTAALPVTVRVLVLAPPGRTDPLPIRYLSIHYRAPGVLPLAHAWPYIRADG